MIRKHLLLSLRSLKKNTLYSVLVTIGLATGIATFISTIQWSAWHLSFDRQIPDREQIYRLTFEEKNEGFYRHTARILHGDALNRIVYSDMLGEIQSICRLAPFRKAAIGVGENKYNEPYAFSADSSFVRLFQPRVIQGKSDGLLTGSFTAILTESTARKLFGEDDPIGKSFKLLHQFDIQESEYTVEAIIADFPGNSHMKISVLTSFKDAMEYEGTSWTYLKLPPSLPPSKVESDLRSFLENNIAEEYVEFLYPRLQAISDIHLHSQKAREMQVNIPYRSIILILLTGMMVFILAWFNYTLLSFSQNQLRVQRLVVQWQMGASKAVLFRHLLFEQVFMGLSSLSIGLVLALLLRPVLRNHGYSWNAPGSGLILLSLGLLFLFILASAHLTSYLSTERLYRYLQQKYLSSKIRAVPEAGKRSLFIRSMIILEFMITFILLASLMLFGQQTRFAMRAQMGSGNPQAIHLHSLHRRIVDQYIPFRDEMMASPTISMVTATMEEPTGQAMDANTFEISGIDEGDKHLFLFPVEENFLRFYDIRVKYGRDMPTEYDPEDSIEYFYLNETAAWMVTDTPASLVGKELNLHFAYQGFIWPGPIRGIVEDFHLSSLEQEISPMVIFPKYTWLYCFSILPEGETGPALEHLEEVWERLFPEFPLEYHLGSELINNLYRNELDQVKILYVFSVLSILIAAMGLFALSGLFMQRKIKSAALRKISGARMQQVVFPEFLSYLWLVFISSVLAIGPSIFVMERWLQNFKYRIAIPAWIFILCFGILLIFSWLAILYHSIRLARINPVEFLREQ